MNSTFLMVSTSSITLQSLGKIVQRAPAVGAKNGVCMFFCCNFFCHAPRPACCSFEGCIVRTSIALPFIGRFRRGFQPFSEGILFQVHYIVLIFVTRWLGEIAVKNFEKSKNRGKGCAHDFVQVAERFEEYSTAVV